MCEAGPTWDNFAEGYVLTWCTGCHAATLAVDDRSGAPVDVDFDTWSAVHAWRVPITARATGPAYDMPPLGGVPVEDVSRFAQWLACGAEGADPAPDACVDRVSAGSRTVATADDVATLCAAGNEVVDLQVSGSVSLDCLCAVTGDLTVTGGDVQLGALGGVDGSVVVTGATTSLAAPVLDRVGGEVRIEGLVASLALPWLRTVGGGLTVSYADTLVTLALPDLVDVGGGFSVTQSRGLVRVEVPRLRQVGGGFEVARLPALEQLDGTRAVEGIGGALVVEDNPRLVGLDSWAFLLLDTVEAVHIRRNGAILGVDGFTLLRTTTAVTIEDNPRLLRIDGFDNLVQVDELRIARNGLQENVFGFVNLEVVGGALVLEDLGALRSLAGFGALTSVGGFRLRGLGPPALPWFTRLEVVRGDFALQGWPYLAAIDGLSGLVTIEGSLTITDNPLLSTAVVQAWVDGREAIGGPVTVSGNAIP